MMNDNDNSQHSNHNHGDNYIMTQKIHKHLTQGLTQHINVKTK